MIEAWHWACLKHQTLSQLLNCCLSLFLKVSRLTQELRIEEKKKGNNYLAYTIKHEKRLRRAREAWEKTSYICVSNVP